MFLVLVFFSFHLSHLSVKLSILFLQSSCSTSHCTEQHGTLYDYYVMKEAAQRHIYGNYVTVYEIFLCKKAVHYIDIYVEVQMRQHTCMHTQANNENTHIHIHMHLQVRTHTRHMIDSLKGIILGIILLC